MNESDVTADDVRAQVAQVVAERGAGDSSPILPKLRRIAAGLPVHPEPDTEQAPVDV